MPPKAQKREMKRAFYAGIQSTMLLMMSISDKYEEDVAATILDEISKEVRAFIYGVIQGVN